MPHMIRGYGLPSEGASSYNGLGALRYGNGCCVGAPRRLGVPLFRPLPDPEHGGGVGGFGGFGFTPGTVVEDSQLQSSRILAGTAGFQTMTDPAAYTTAKGAGTAVLGLGALALFFFLR